MCSGNCRLPSVPAGFNRAALQSKLQSQASLLSLEEESEKLEIEQHDIHSAQSDDAMSSSQSELLSEAENTEGEAPSSDEEFEDESDFELAQYESAPIDIPVTKASFANAVEPHFANSHITAEDMREAMRKNFDYRHFDDETLRKHKFVPLHILVEREDARILARSIPRRFR